MLQISVCYAHALVSPQKYLHYVINNSIYETTVSNIKIFIEKYNYHRFLANVKFLYFIK